MPITEAERREASVDPDEPVAEPTPVGASETETDLLLAFLSENHDTAFTRREVVRDADFAETASPETVKETLLTLPREPVDIGEDLTASGIVVDDVSAALEELVAEGVVECRAVEDEDGEPVEYFRLAESAALDRHGAGLPERISRVAAGGSAADLSPPGPRRRGTHRRRLRRRNSPDTPPGGR